MLLKDALQVNDIVGTAVVVAFSAVRRDYYHALDDRTYNLLKPVRVPKDKDPVFRYDRYSRFH